jgi:hypothetical protein
MSEYSRFNAWDWSCLDRGSYGMTAGDSFWQGLRDYNQMRPCPNGLPLDARLPSDCEHWRKRIEKAKRDIEWHRREFEAAELVFSEDDISDLILIAEGFNE